jgi:hypothetical protein
MSAPSIPAGRLACPYTRCRYVTDPANANSHARQYSHHLMFHHDGHQLDHTPDPLPYRWWHGLSLPVLVVGSWLVVVLVVRVLAALAGWL